MNTKKVPFVVAVGVSLMLPSLAFANGSVYDAKITQIYIGTDGYAVVTVDKTIGGSRPTCATNPNTMGFAAETAEGKAVLATLTAAFLAGKYVNLRGESGATTCLWPGHEDLGWAVVH